MKRNYKNYPVFTEKNGSKHFFKLFKNLVTSAAFSGLKYTQRLLFICMALSYKGPAKSKRGKSNNKKINKLIFGCEDCFIFPEYIYSEKFNLYKNASDFNKDVDILISHGFIIRITEKYHGHTVFRFSDNWKTYSENGPFSVEPVSKNSIKPHLRRAGSIPSWQTSEYSVNNFNPQFVCVYESLLSHKTFIPLSKKQKLLYICMLFSREKDKAYMKREGFSGEYLFTFPKYTYEKIFKLYKSHDADFKKDRERLIEHGFISLVSSGRNTRQKNIYSFSSKWHRS